MEGTVDFVKIDPNFASVCSFVELFSDHLGINITFPAIVRGVSHMISLVTVEPKVESSLLSPNNCSSSINKNWIALHIRLLKRLKYVVKEERWERSLAKFCATYSADDALTVEQLGYVGTSSNLRLRILKNLLENQFDRNAKFKEIVNATSVDKLRRAPLGYDMKGNAYWFLIDVDFNFMIYRENSDKDSELEVKSESIEEIQSLLEKLRDMVHGGGSDSNVEQLTTGSSEHDEVSAEENSCDALDGLSKESAVSNMLTDTTLTVTEHLTNLSSIDITVKVETSSSALSSDIQENKSADDDTLLINEVNEVDIHSSPAKINDVSTASAADEIDNDVKTSIPCNKLDNAQRGRGRGRGHLQGHIASEAIESDSCELQGAVRRSGRVRKPVQLFTVAPTSSGGKKSNSSSIKQVQPDAEEEESDDASSRPQKRKRRAKDVECGKGKEKSHKRRKKSHSKKKKKKRRAGGLNRWETQSSTEEEDYDEQYFVDALEEEMDEQEFTERLYRSDDSDWNKPESDFDANNSGGDEELDPSKHGRNFVRVCKRQKSQLEPPEVEPPEVVFEPKSACGVCFKDNRPEWLLLCDLCDAAYHAMCLRPALFVVPEGDWFCPTCSHQRLLAALEKKLEEMKALVAKCNAKALMQERLRYVNVNISNIIEKEDRPARQKVAVIKKEEDEEFDEDEDSRSSADDESGSSSCDDDESGDGASSESDYQRTTRKRSNRAAAATVNYNFSDFDKQIDEAINTDDKYVLIKEHPELSERAPPRPGRAAGKDMANIYGPDWDKTNNKDKEILRPNEDEEASGAENGTCDAEEEEEEGGTAPPPDASTARLCEGPPLVVVRKRKKFNRLSDVDDDDDAKDEEYQLSEEDDASEYSASGSGSDDEDNSASSDQSWKQPTRRSSRLTTTAPSAKKSKSKKRRVQYSSEDSEDSLIARRRRQKRGRILKGGKKGSGRGGQSKRRPPVVRKKARKCSESEEEWSPRKPRRAAQAARQKVLYHHQDTESDSEEESQHCDEEVEDAEDGRPALTGLARGVKAAAKKKRKESSGEEYVASDAEEEESVEEESEESVPEEEADSDDVVVKKRRIVAKSKKAVVSSCEEEDDDSDDNSHVNVSQANETQTKAVAIETAHVEQNDGMELAAPICQNITKELPHSLPPSQSPVYQPNFSPAAVLLPLQPPEQLDSLTNSSTMMPLMPTAVHHHMLPVHSIATNYNAPDMQSQKSLGMPPYVHDSITSHPPHPMFRHMPPSYPSVPGYHPAVLSDSMYGVSPSMFAGPPMMTATRPIYHQPFITPVVNSAPAGGMLAELGEVTPTVGLLSNVPPPSNAAAGFSGFYIDSILHPDQQLPQMCMTTGSALGVEPLPQNTGTENVSLLQLMQE